MPGMKRDCGGAAAILGAFKATIKQVNNPQRSDEIVGTLPLKNEKSTIITKIT